MTFERHFSRDSNDCKSAKTEFCTSLNKNDWPKNCQFPDKHLKTKATFTLHDIGQIFVLTIRLLRNSSAKPTLPNKFSSNFLIYSWWIQLIIGYNCKVSKCTELRIGVGVTSSLINAALMLPAVGHAMTIQTWQYQLENLFLDISLFHCLLQSL